MYFNQQMGALHTLCWSKSFVSALKQVFPFFPSQTEKRKKKERRSLATLLEGAGYTLKIFECEIQILTIFGGFRVKKLDYKCYS